jgi:hypothetical protein
VDAAVLVHDRESVLFIGTQFSILYTSMYSPAEAATLYRRFLRLKGLSKESNTQAKRVHDTQLHDIRVVYTYGIGVPGARIATTRSSSTCAFSCSAATYILNTHTHCDVTA